MAAEVGRHRRTLRHLEFPAPSGLSALLTLFVTVAIIAGLYFGRNIFVPLALAVLLSFALAPVVRKLRRLGVPNLPAVLLVVTLAFLVIISFVSIVAWQVADLAQRLPAYQTNIERKIDGFLETPPGGRLFGRATEMFRDIGRKIDEVEQQSDELPGSAGEPESEETKPVPVVVQQPEPTSGQIIQTIVGPLISPLATAGIVIVFVIFMLLKRDDLRDRVIRLVGSRDLPRTTQALDDAARRVGRYLLMQLVVNTTYGIPIGIGLWLIGIPNPVLWGVLCTVLRFVPYIGPVIAAFFPLALAVAVDPGWSTFLWAGGLFIVIELISNNLIEPLLYGSSTGLSPVAVIAAAVFWTWLWGPIGLLLSTPLTVCLVVLGQHVPQLSFLDVLLGDAPVMSPPEQTYQRLLIGDSVEVTEHAEEYLRDGSLAGFYGDVLAPALALADNDRVRGALGEEQHLCVAESALTVVDNLTEWEPNGAASADEDDAARQAGTTVVGSEGRMVICAAARDELDEAASAAFAQVLEHQGIDVRVLSFHALQTAALRELQIGTPAAIVLFYMNSDSLAHARFLVRRLRRRAPDATIIAVLYGLDPEQRNRRDPVEATRADHVATSFAEALEIVTAALGAEASADGAEDEPAVSVASSGR